MRQPLFHQKLRPAVDALERRRLLSALPAPVAYPVDSLDLPGSVQPESVIGIGGSASPQGYSPAQIKAAYGISNISFNGTAGSGAGQTIAIVGAMDNPKLVDSTDPNFGNSDLHNFDVAMGLPDPPSFVKVDATGGTNYPPADGGWANEMAVDVEWTHALAPQANILLVESASTNLNGLISGAANWARSAAGVSVVTMSFSIGEFAGETQYDSFLTTPAGHAGVTFVTASGDGGDPGGYPGFSPNVISVGGTSLYTSNGAGAYSNETAYNLSGGGVSQYESAPAFQHGLSGTGGMRAGPDVAFEGNQNTGVSVYDSYNGGASTPWFKMGGTSFSAPAWAGLIAITDQGRALLGLASLDGPSQTLPRLYELNSADYHDITSGSSIGSIGATAGAGYDLVTGLGSPIANKLIPDLAGGNTVSGETFDDANANGVLDGAERGATGFTVYLDKYNSSTIVGVDQSVASGSDGTFSFVDLPGGSYTFRVNTPAGWDLTSVSASFTLTLGFGSDLTGHDIGFRPNGQAAQLVFVQQPSAVVANHVIAPVISVKVENASGGLMTTDTSAITLSLSSGTGPLGGSLTVNAVGGVAMFSDISLPAPGTDALQATDGNLMSATSASFVVSPDVVTHMVFGTQPTNTVAGIVMTPPISIYLEDENGHIVSTDVSQVTLSLAPLSTTNAPTGTLTVNAVNGIARFSNVVFTSAGTAALVATDGSLPAITSSTFSTVIVPTKLVFAQAPTPGNVGVAINPPIIVDVADYLGNPVAGDTSAVTLTVTGGSTTLGGTATVNAVDGVATFSDITLTTAGTYTLTATDGTLTSAITPSFAVTVPGTVTATAGRSTLGTNLIAGSKIHASLSLTETATTTIAGLSNVLTQIYAFASDGTSILLASVTRKVAMHAGKKFNVNVLLTKLPPGLNGTYTVKALVTDPAGNFSVSGVLATVKIAQPFIALTETVTKLTLPASVVSPSKSTALAVVKIHNGGNSTSTGSTSVGVYASPDGRMADAVLINSITRKMLIRANGNLVVTVPIKKIPAGLNGSYVILAQATDPKGTESFISSGKTITMDPAFISLAATAGAASPTSIAPGRTIEISLTVKNNGNVDSTGTATITLGVSSDGATVLPGSAMINRAMIIRAGKSTTLRLRIAVPSTLTAGAYFPYLLFTQAGHNVLAFGSQVTVG